MAYIAVTRLWHGERLVLLRTPMSRLVAEARLGSFALLSTVKPTGDHGDVALEIQDHFTGEVIGAPVHFTHADAGALLAMHFHTRAAQLDHVLSDEYAQQRYDALTSEGPTE